MKASKGLEALTGTQEEEEEEEPWQPEGWGELWSSEAAADPSMGATSLLWSTAVELRRPGLWLIAVAAFLAVLYRLLGLARPRGGGWGGGRGAVRRNSSSARQLYSKPVALPLAMQHWQYLPASGR